MAVVEAAVTEVPEEIVAAVVAEEVVTVEVTAAEEVASVATGAAVIAEVTVAGEVASVATEAAVIVEVTVAEVAFVVIEAAEVVADSAAAEAGIRTLARRSTSMSDHLSNYPHTVVLPVALLIAADNIQKTSGWCPSTRQINHSTGRQVG